MKTTMARARSMRGHAAGIAAMAAVLAGLLASAGCDSSSIVPPPPADTNRSRGSSLTAAYDGEAGAPASAPAPAAGKPAARHPAGAPRVVEMILARPVDGDRDFLARSLHRELGKALIPFRLVEPQSPDQSTPEALAAEIRSATERGVSGLIVEPREEPAVIDALHAAAGRGIAVLLLDRPVPPRGGKTLPRVEYSGLADAGRRIVADVLEADRKFQRTRPGRAVVLHNRSDDPYSEGALASLLVPIRASGKKTDVVTFEGDTDRAIAALRKSLDADPGMDILLADDKVGMGAGLNLRSEWTREGRPDFLLAGYASYDSRTPEVLNRVRNFADRSVDAYCLKTFQAIRSLLEGKPVGDVVEVPITFHHQTILFVPTAEKPPTPGKKAGKS